MSESILKPVGMTGVCKSIGWHESKVQSTDYKWAACKSLRVGICAKKEPRCGCINSEVGAVRSR